MAKRRWTLPSAFLFEMTSNLGSQAILSFRAQNIEIDADSEIDIRAGKAIRLKAGRIDLN